jgi:hypothetical protein
MVQVCQNRRRKLVIQIITTNILKTLVQLGSVVKSSTFLFRISVPRQLNAIWKAESFMRLGKKAGFACNQPDVTFRDCAPQAMATQQQ